jgi:hypothetical protein
VCLCLCRYRNECEEAKEDRASLRAQLDELRSKDVVPRIELLEATKVVDAKRLEAETLQMQITTFVRNLEDLQAKLEV